MVPVPRGGDAGSAVLTAIRALAASSAREEGGEGGNREREGGKRIVSATQNAWESVYRCGRLFGNAQGASDGSGGPCAATSFLPALSHSSPRPNNNFLESSTGLFEMGSGGRQNWYQTAKGGSKQTGTVMPPQT